MKRKSVKQKIGAFSLVLVIILQIIACVPSVNFAVSSNMIDHGLKIEYFDDAELSNFKFTDYIEKTINFEWGLKSPSESVSTKNYSVRWTGKITPTATGQYTFYTYASGGVRLWIDNQSKPLINNWEQHNLTEDKGTITYNLTKDKEYYFRLEYHNTNKYSILKLLWDCETISKSIVPVECFSLPKTDDSYNTTDSDRDGISDIIEMQGYIFDSSKKLTKWTGDPEQTYFKTNPYGADTNANGSNDYTEAKNFSFSSSPVAKDNPMVSLSDYSSDTFATIAIQDEKQVTKKYGIYVGDDTSLSYLTVAQAIGRTVGTYSNGQILINGEGLGSVWNIYFADKDLENVVGQLKKMFDKNIYNVVLRPGMNVTLYKDTVNNAPSIKWSSFTDTSSYVVASITPGTNNTITNVSAKVSINGKETLIPMTTVGNSSFYYNNDEINDKVDPNYNAQIVVTYKDSNSKVVTSTAVIGNAPLINKDDLSYVTLSTPIDILSTSDTMGKESGSVTNTSLLTDYPTAESYVFEITSDKWSSSAGSVTINDQTTYLGTGDSSVGRKTTNDQWSVTFYYDIDYSRWWKSYEPDKISGVGDREYAYCQDAGVRNNKANSIKVNGGATAVLYEDSNFGGKSKSYSSDRDDLGRDTINRFEMSSFKIIAPSKDVPYDAAKNSPTTSSIAIISRPTDNFKIDWTDFKESLVDGKINSDNASFSIKLLGYFDASKGNKFNLYSDTYPTNTDNTIQIPTKNEIEDIASVSNDDNQGVNVLNTIDNYSTTMVLSTTDATAYVVKVTSDKISSNEINVTLNDISCNLGASDSRDNGQSASASYSPTRSDIIFVPADTSKPQNLSVKTSIGDWKDSTSSTPTIKVEVLGYYSPTAKLTYKQLDTLDVDDYIIKDLATTDTEVKTCSFVKKTLLRDYPKAYFVKVTSKNAGSDSIEVKINNQTINLATSGTLQGNGSTPTATTRSGYMLVKSDASSPYEFKVSNTIDSNFKTDGTIDVQVVGYFY